MDEEKELGNNGEPSPEYKTAKNWVKVFPDGSRIIIEVDVPVGVDEAEAVKAFNIHIAPGIEEIEAEQTRSDSLL